MPRWMGIFLFAALAVALRPLPSAASGEWRSKMKELGSTFQELLLDISSDDRFNAPRNRARIERNARKLSALSHGLNMKKSALPDVDPSVIMISGLFSREADHAATELRRGNRSYARGILRSLTGYCIACHTRNTSGPSFSLPSDAAVQALKRSERGEYFAATRQFDKALDEFEAILADPAAAQARPLEWERAIRFGLAIAVRVKKDPERAAALVDRVIATQKAPLFVREQASQWKETLSQWKAEPKREAVTEEGLYAESKRLIAQARTAQRYPADRAADVLYLRATAVVHELLSVAPEGKHAEEALFMAGFCYDVLRDLGIWSLHELYYLTCIYNAPHSEIARTCYKHYEESVYAGYSGSGGESLPADVKKTLSELDALSSPEKPPTPPK